MGRFHVACVVVLGGLLTLPAIGAAKPGRRGQFEQLKSLYLYHLADWSGPVATHQARLAYDSTTGEVIVVNPKDSSVRIFDQHGMEIFSFGDDPALKGVAVAVAPHPQGDMFVLVMSSVRSTIWRCNFRGELRSEVQLRGIPEDFGAEFRADNLLFENGRLYAVDVGRMKVAVADETGAVERTWTLGTLLEMDAAQVRDAAMHDLTVDRAGNLLFTIPTDFKVYVISPAGEVRSFGSKGSTPGNFNVIAGITTDEDRNIYVSDILRAVVMVFDRDHRFLGEFGYRGKTPDSLVAPKAIAAARGKVFVSQSGGHGVSAFNVRISSDRNGGEPRLSD